MTAITNPHDKKHGGIPQTSSEKAFHLFCNVLMAALILITAYPMLYVVFCSLSDPVDFALAQGQGMMWRPAGFSLEGYRNVLRMDSIWTGYKNTLIYVSAGTVISMAMTISGAFIFAHKDFMLKGPLMRLAVFTMYFSGGMIPTYLTVQQMGLLNTYWAVILPGCVSVYNLIVLRTSFQGIPPALLESAHIDGAGDWVTLTRIILPLSTASLATITLFYMVTYWGAWYNAMVYLQSSRSMYPLQLYLREILLKDDTVETYMESLAGRGANNYLLKEVIKYCTIIVSTLPILLVYPFLQKYFVKGVMVGAIKE